MQLLIYAAPANTVGRNLWKRIQSTELAAGNGAAAYCTALPALDEYLRAPLGLSPVGILIPSDEDDLDSLIRMRPLMRDMRLILILPTGCRPIIAHDRVHRLRPRFITFADNNMNEVIAVLRKMKFPVCDATV